jgi:hypothetical protein
VVRPLLKALQLTSATLNEVHIGVKLILFLSAHRNVCNAQAAWLRCLSSAAFASLKKYPSDFFNSDFAGTEPKEAPYETTGKSVKL